MDRIAVVVAGHVLAAVVWIGGVAVATTVAIPAVRRGSLGADRLRAFQAIESRFVWQARAAVIVVGATGLYMTAALDLWDRFLSATFWWMPALLGVWLLFALLLFVLQPLVLSRHFPRWARARPEAAFACLHPVPIIERKSIGWGKG